MELGRVDDLARGIVSSLVADIVTRKGRLLSRLAGAIAVLALLAAVVADPPLRWLLVVLAVFAALASVGLFAVRKIAVAAIHRFASPRDLAPYRQAIASAIDRADLPSGPVSGVRMAWRLRRGVGPEVQRFRAIAADLSAELDTTH